MPSKNEINYNEVLEEEFYRFQGPFKRKDKENLFRILSCCREIRNTKYPIHNSKNTELKIVEFQAHKESSMIHVNGSLSLDNDDKTDCENRTFDAYIIKEKDASTKVYLDITRLCVPEEPKMIRTNEQLIPTENGYLDIGIYVSNDETFEQEIPFTEEMESRILIKKMGNK